MALYLCILNLMFVYFKLQNKLDWSWYKVFSPMYVYVGLALLNTMFSIRIFRAFHGLPF